MTLRPYGTKNILLSKTAGGALAAGATGVSLLVHCFKTGDLSMLPEAVTSIVGAMVAVYGRYVAITRITKL